jgi:hypothetical protein
MKNTSSARPLASALLAAAFVFTAHAANASAQATQPPPLAINDIADITTLVMLEDRREFDSTALARILRSSHPEVRRRAAVSVGRIANPGGRPLLVAARGDADTAVAASVVFATGQLYDTASVGWLESLLSTATATPTVAVEAAGALGKIRSAETRAVLARFLASAPNDARGVSGWRSAALHRSQYNTGRHFSRGPLARIRRRRSSLEGHMGSLQTA